MKHKLIYLILSAVLIVSIVTGCSAQAVSENGTTESTAVSDESKAESDTVAQSAESSSEVTTGSTDSTDSKQVEDNSQQKATKATAKSGQNKQKAPPMQPRGDLQLLKRSRQQRNGRLQLKDRQLRLQPSGTPLQRPKKAV